MLGAASAHAASFSVLAGGPVGLPGDDIFNPGPLPVPPAVTPGAGLGIEVDGLHYGHRIQGGTIFFSVDAPSVGAAGTGVFAESGGLVFPGDHPADIYVSAGLGGNAQFTDGDGFANPGVGVTIPLGLAEPASFGPGVTEDLDGLDLRLASPTGIVHFSVDAFSAAVIYGAPLSGADVFIAPTVAGYDVPVPAFYAPAPFLGLDMGGFNTDDIDALVIIDPALDGMFTGVGGVDTVLFSLTPGSAAFGIAASPYFGLGPDDVLFADTTGAAGLAIPGFALGLVPGVDNLNALDIVPEPATGVLALVGALFAATSLRRRRFAA